MMRAWLDGDTSALTQAQAIGLAAREDRLDPEFEWDVTAAEMIDFPVARGREAWRELWGRWMEGWERYSWSLGNWSEAGEYVIVDVEVQAVGGASGAAVSMRQTHVWTLRGGKVLRLAQFNDRASALRAIETA
jgi:ketosteroid isomerase-like protein